MVWNVYLKNLMGKTKIDWVEVGKSVERYLRLWLNFKSGIIDSGTF